MSFDSGGYTSLVTVSGNVVITIAPKLSAIPLSSSGVAGISPTGYVVDRQTIEAGGSEVYHQRCNLHSFACGKRVACDLRWSHKHCY